MQGSFMEKVESRIRKVSKRRHRLKYKNEAQRIQEGQVVLINSDDRNRGKWSIGIVEKVFKGKDGIIRVARLRTRKTTIERDIEHLYHLELECNVTEHEPTNDIKFTHKQKNLCQREKLL